MQRFEGYPDFDAWRSSLIRAKAGFRVAPEDFYITIPDGEKRTFFTWSEVLELDNDLFRPAGWYIPSYLDWERLIEVYRKTDRFASKLRLTSSGWVSPTLMKEYKLTADSSLISPYYSFGYYWSRSQYNNDHAYSLRYGETPCPMVSFSLKRSGLAIRCFAL